MNSLIIANSKHTETISAIWNPEVDKNRQMQRHKDMEFKDAGQPKSDWTEEVKFEDK